MAEMNNEAAKSVNPRKIRSRKLNSKVDLTAMVDLAFLLITFFMLTTSLTKPHAMDLTIPDSTGKPLPVDENRTMSIVIDGNDNAHCFMGMLADAKPSQIALNDTKSLRKEILANKRLAREYGQRNGKPDYLIVLIKPGKKSSYRNLVDVLDEMAISEVQSYAITDLTPDEQKLLK